jgi:hypothetical protein
VRNPKAPPSTRRLTFAALPGEQSPTALGEGLSGSEALGPPAVHGIHSEALLHPTRSTALAQGSMWRASATLPTSPLQLRRAVSAVADNIAPYLAATSILHAVAQGASAATKWAEATTDAFIGAYMALVHANDAGDGVVRDGSEVVGRKESSRHDVTPRRVLTSRVSLADPKLAQSSASPVDMPFLPTPGTARCKPASKSQGQGKRKGRGTLTPLKRLTRQLTRHKVQSGMRSRAALHIQERTHVLREELAAVGTERQGLLKLAPLKLRRAVPPPTK